MPSLASRYQSATPFPANESQSAANGPAAIASSIVARSASTAPVKTILFGGTSSVAGCGPQPAKTASARTLQYTPEPALITNIQFQPAIHSIPNPSGFDASAGMPPSVGWVRVLPKGGERNHPAHGSSSRDLSFSNFAPAARDANHPANLPVRACQQPEPLDRLSSALRRRPPRCRGRIQTEISPTWLHAPRAPRVARRWHGK